MWKYLLLYVLKPEIVPIGLNSILFGITHSYYPEHAYSHNEVIYIILGCVVLIMHICSCILYIKGVWTWTFLAPWTFIKNIPSLWRCYHLYNTILIYNITVLPFNEIAPYVALQNIFWLRNSTIENVFIYCSKFPYPADIFAFKKYNSRSSYNASSVIRGVAMFVCRKSYCCGCSWLVLP